MNINQEKKHTFHIPVMGTAYTVDTPCKVAHYGISSVISIIDHRLTEQVREYYSKKNGLQFKPIAEHEEDCRANRITAYLNMVRDIVIDNFKKVKESAFETGSEITKYFEMLPDKSWLKQEYRQMLKSKGEKARELQNKLRDKMSPGSIDVNIMTKLDSVNYNKRHEALPQEFNDAHAALRGFANSKLQSSIVLSAGLNPRLFTYMASFADFFPDVNGKFNKKIILKVSDYRSALIQGKFLAKKGLWVSEFRIESGLNCGGHAFASDGYLLGPILEEFRENKEQLFSSLFQMYQSSLQSIDKTVPVQRPTTEITVQGGVGTVEEHEFLLDYYQVNAVGWGTPFLLVPEAINVDNKTLDILSKADEKQLYLSNLSPLGVPFNTVRGSSAGEEIDAKVVAGKPGATCIKKHLTFNNEYTKKPICVASRQYQNKKIKELETSGYSVDELKNKFKNVVEKMCLCVGLSNPVIYKHDLPISKGIQGVAVCPGPNMAYFSKIVSLKEMVDHIYGRINLVSRTERPHMFIKELQLYLNYFRQKIEESSDDLNESQLKYFNNFKENLEEGINYYHHLFDNVKEKFMNLKTTLFQQLNEMKAELDEIMCQEKVNPIPLVVAK
ncbi:MAG: hypothetical protein ACOCVN_00595 [bacterium]